MVELLFHIDHAKSEAALADISVAIVKNVVVRSSLLHIRVALDTLGQGKTNLAHRPSLLVGPWDVRVSDSFLEGMRNPRLELAVPVGYIVDHFEATIVESADCVVQKIFLAPLLFEDWDFFVALDHLDVAQGGVTRTLVRTVHFIGAFVETTLCQGRFFQFLSFVSWIILFYGAHANGFFRITCCP